MAINFKLADRFTVTVEDPMHRDWVGWDDHVDLQDLFERNRGLWLLGTRAKRQRYATFSHGGLIKMVAAIDGFELYQFEDPTKRPKSAIVGRLLTDGPVWSGLIDQAVDNYRNPVTYIANPRVVG